MSEEKKQPVTARPAATVLMLRDGPDGMEVFMVKRHHKIDFATGALVFPGGSADPGDASAIVRKRSDGGADLSEEALRFRIASIREAFEETGLLLCRKADATEVLEADECEALHHYRDKLEANELDFGQFLEAENLIACLDRLAHFAHWITPPGMPKRFDTHFYVARTPARQLAKHDGSENVDSVWITPQAACDAAVEAGDTVNNDWCCFSVDVLCNDEQWTSALRSLLQAWEQILHGRNLLVINQDVRTLQFCFHLFAIGNEVWREVTAIELHSFHGFYIRFRSFCFFHGNHTFVAYDLHRLGD